MKNMRVEIKGNVAELTIDRAKALNALNKETLEELRSFLAKKHPFRALIVTGAGERAFVAGADISEMHQLSREEMVQFCTLGQKVMTLLERAPFATIAAVNGYALGGGLELALGCDFIYASKNAILGLPEVTLGLIPGFGGTQRLLRAVGTRRAKELILTGEKISAEKAYDWGIVNKVCDPEKLLSDASEKAEMISKNSEKSILAAKNAINKGADLTLDEGLEIEKVFCASCIETKECRDAMAKFLKK